MNESTNNTTNSVLPTNRNNSVMTCTHQISVEDG